ncbi:hypothetical protein FJY71_00600 [candidate division WOR-3 bacterium]|nr:hypothetical protein [candidate division WOR-3 bacterium]
MNRVVLFCLMLAAVAAAAAKSEAKLYVNDPQVLRVQLSSLLGELDVCTFGTDDRGRNYLVIDADAGQLAALRAAGAEVEITWPDVRDKFRAMTGRDPEDGSFRDFGYFFNYWELRDTLLRLATLHPGICRLDSSMRSFQDRPLYCLKVSDNPDSAENEPQAFFNGATHAREPLSTHTCVGYASILCRDYGRDSLVTWLVNNREVFFVPVMNPDGYVYNSDSGGVSSNWRKNRRGPVPPYVGIDLNRNYGYKWGYDNGGSSPTPSSETYRGPNRWSEPEVEAIHQFERQHRFRCQLDFHTYGRLNMYPWAYIGDAPPEQALLDEMADTFALHNGYTSGQWYYVLYTSNGTSIDWEFADTLDEGQPKFISYAFSFELGINDFWYGANDSAYIHSEVRLNMPNCFYLTRLCGVWLEPRRLVVNDTALGNGTGRLDPGEAAQLWFTVENRALHAADSAYAVTARLVPADTVVQVLTPSSSFPTMRRRTARDNRAAPFTVRCSPGAQPGDTVGLRLDVTFTDLGVSVTQPLAFSLVIGDSLVGVDDRPAPRASRAEPTLVRNLPASGTERRTQRVFDMTGRQVSDPSRLAPGVYFLRPAGCSATRKVVVQR